MKSGYSSVSIYHVAREAGVNISTVSRALVNDPRISSITRSRIKKIAQRLKFSVDPLASSLAQRKRKKDAFRGTLAWIDNFPTQNGSLRIIGFKEYFDGALARATELGFALETFWLRDPALSSHRMSSILRARNVQGLLLAPQPHSYHPITLRWEWFSIITFGFSLKEPDFHKVTNHQYHSLILTFRRLLALGYRRIGLALSSQDIARNKYNYLAGFLVEQNRVPPKNRVVPYMASEFTFEKFSSWYEAQNPEAIIAIDPIIIDWLKSLKRNVPRDVGFADLSLRAFGDFASGLCQQNIKTGRIAAEFLVRLIERNERGIPPDSSNLLCESKWLPGSTVRRLN